ncbi:ATP-binding cassette domain-containing protein [Agriterribacter sp.]|uniref:ATP-binding cassette domain-containing protein n=1 Tax=Agriterribacter sp. TaxID=2821509 RepID=UPI002D0FE10E|nr:ATP-binding cassette domain-containing protein [Agriterribacter sp.]HRP55505.1 ATP-binding cassette domain-containing protein [Agriterribacter sp.]
MAFPFLQLNQLTVQLNGRKIIDHVDLTIQNNEQWAITGPSGSGKTILAHTLAGRHYYSGSIIFNGQTARRPYIAVVEQQHRFKNLSGTSDFYYQQRYNASDAENTITVAEKLDIGNRPHATLTSGIALADLPSLVHIEHILQEPLIQLSNGENKRLQIAMAILSEPQLLILDNPFVGLDTEGRSMLNGVINTLNNAGIKIILITSATEIPDSITHIAIIENGKLVASLPKKDFSTGKHMYPAGFRIDQTILQTLHQPLENNFEYAVKMVNVNVQYGNRSILRNISWEVKKGEHWSVSGPNGAGKSTLLSLITGDNTKAYANEIYLFDRRRGSGESIWDIKRKIGYVSPEMHLYFDYTATCFEAVASGLFDSIGLFRTLTAAQHSQVNRWIALFHLKAVENKLLSLLSAGEQRLVLLARALVKNPPLLILDEPCQGLDQEHIQQFRGIIDDICRMFDTTLLYVSHYKEEIPDCITRFMQIDEGKASFVDV